MKETVLELLEKIRKAESCPESVGKLPDNSCFLDDTYILCKKRKYGVSRFPYSNDGLVLWVSQNGFITATEARLTVFRPSYTDETPCIGFFMGLENGDKKYFPVSLSEANCSLYEPYDVKRYTVFAPHAAYYITDADGVVGAVRIFVGEDKKMHFTVSAVNTTDEKKSLYLATYIEALLRFAETEATSQWVKCARFGERLKNGSFVFRTPDGGFMNSIAINTRVDGNMTLRSSTTARRDFLGICGRAYSNAESLKNGKFELEVDVTRRSDLPNMGDIVHFDLMPGESGSVEYVITLSYDFNKAEEIAADDTVAAYDIDNEVEELLAAKKKSLEGLNIKFDGWNIGKNTGDVVNHFLKVVQQQVSFCAFGKNYAGPYLGTRDVCQQLEAALMWSPETARACIVRAYNYIDVSGRPSRGFTVTPKPGMPSMMDMSPYIDQGLWMIDVVYAYLAYTGDFSILDEDCGYYILHTNSYSLAQCSDQRDSLLDHMFRVVDYLLKNLDTECGTSCLRVLFGDWNDAIDGLGKTDDKVNRPFGTGVTVMGTLQLYRNLDQLCEILTKVGGYDDRIADFKEKREAIREGFLKYAVQTAADGTKRIVHGWGDRLSYYVGSLCDSDGLDRISFASNAYYAISGMADAEPGLKADAVAALKSLDSKYGLRTLWPPFTPKSVGVGRIKDTVYGTAENGCAYVHGSMFSIWALFIMGESEFAWRELEKSIVISHDNPSLTTFAMPNSYFENKDLNMDGESGGDWYTGSGTTLIKAIVWYGFGVKPTLDTVKIEVPKFMPADSMSVSLFVNGKAVKVSYKNNHSGRRTYFVNGKECETAMNKLSGVPMLVLDKAGITGDLDVTVTD